MAPLSFVAAVAGAQDAQPRGSWFLEQANRGIVVAGVLGANAQGKEYALRLTCASGDTGEITSSFSAQEGNADALANKNTVVEAMRGDAVLNSFRVNGLSQDEFYLHGKPTAVVLESWRRADRLVVRSGNHSIVLSARGSAQVLDGLTNGWGCGF
ncbi:hypothetical protein [Croceibacterium xixiisoli]|uniref:hypothetical protein n=1 Tax=Croceibacterium xixiisoli TaxID=1476466 RepID=UPI0013709786|nr:hypothetical protein [Croceibacterium xixiisoli]